MASIAQNTTSQRVPEDLKPETLVPKSPERLSVDAINKKIAAVVQQASGLLTNDLDRPNLTLAINGHLVETNGKVAEGFANVTGFAQPSLPQHEREARLAALVAQKTKEVLAAQTPIVADYAAHLRSFGVSIATKPGDSGLSPVELREQSEVKLAKDIASEVESIIREKFGGLEQSKHTQRIVENNSRIEQIKTIINTPNDQITSADIDKWIKSSGLYDLDTDGKLKYPAEIAKLQQSGLLEGESSSVSPRFFKDLRLQMMAATAVSTVCVAAVGAATVAGALGIITAVPALTGIFGANFAFQRYRSYQFMQKFDAMLKEAKSELGEAGPMQSGIAWAGAMFKFIKEYNPVWVLPNRTEFWNSHPSTSVDAVLNHLKQIAQHGAHSMVQTPNNGPLFKDQKFSDYYRQALPGITELAKRWKDGQDKQLDVAFWGLASSAISYGGLLLAGL